MKRFLHATDTPGGGPLDDEYRLAEPEPGGASPAASPQASAPAAARGPLWYLAQPGAKQIGPISLDEMLALVRSGKSTAADLAWREGMPVWLPVGQTAELAPALLSPARPAAVSAESPTTGVLATGVGHKSPNGERWQTDPAGLAPSPLGQAARSSSSEPAVREGGHSDWELSDVTRFLRSPSFFRGFGRIAGALACAVFLVSVVRVPDGKSWFEGAILLAGLFFAGEAVGSLIERLDKLASKSPRP